MAPGGHVGNDPMLRRWHRAVGADATVARSRVTTHMLVGGRASPSRTLEIQGERRAAADFNSRSEKSHPNR